ncbi:MLP-like protein 28 [Solanum stenotomum]|uniref:MLP-like protein 28 n=1 Tax=Solanum stenotomum TaxID=172797 RepID=UPI0020D18621|nr:MLP-like protein 28 [Solanum stenotomum]
MGLKGKLIASTEVKCGGHLIHNIFHTNTHHIANISPNKINRFEIHESEIIKVGSIVSWRYNEDGEEKFAKQVIEAINPHTKLIIWKVIEGNVLKLYNSFIVITSSEQNWTTLAFEYEKKSEDIPEPITLLGFFFGVIKEIDGHLLKQ